MFGCSKKTFGTESIKVQFPCYLHANQESKHNTYIPHSAYTVTSNFASCESSRARNSVKANVKSTILTFAITDLFNLYIYLLAKNAKNKGAVLL